MFMSDWVKDEINFSGNCMAVSHVTSFWKLRFGNCMAVSHVTTFRVLLLFIRPLEKIIEQIVWIMIFYITINHGNTFIDFAQNISGCRGPDFNESLLNEEFPYFANWFLFDHKGFVGDIVANCAIWEKDAYFGSMLVFAHIECAP